MNECETSSSHGKDVHDYGKELNKELEQLRSLETVGVETKKKKYNNNNPGDCLSFLKHQRHAIVETFSSKTPANVCSASKDVGDGFYIF